MRGVSSRHSVCKARCLVNLARVDGGKEAYRAMHNLTNGTQAVVDEFIELVDGGWPRMTCPGGGSYAVGAIGEKATCSLHGAAP